MVWVWKRKSKTALLTKKYIDNYNLFPILISMKKTSFTQITLSLSLLILVAFLIQFEEQYLWLHVPRVIFGSIIVLFLPGYWITLWVFPLSGTERVIDPSETTNSVPREDDAPHSIDFLERLVLSVALSISSVPLLLFYINFLWVPLTIWSVFYTICGVTLLGIAWSVFVQYRHGKNK